MTALRFLRDLVLVALALGLPLLGIPAIALILQGK